MIIGDGNGQKNNTLFLVDCRWLRVETDLWMQMVCFPSLFPIAFFFLIIIILGSLNANIFIFLIDVLFFKL